MAPTFPPTVRPAVKEAPTDRSCSDKVAALRARTAPSIRLLEGARPSKLLQASADREQKRPGLATPAGHPASWWDWHGQFWTSERGAAGFPESSGGNALPDEN